MHPTGHRDWPVSKISSFLANRNLLVGASCCTETWESPFYVFPTAGCLKLLTQKIFKMKHSTTIFTQCILPCFSDALGKGIAWTGSMPSVALISVRLIRFGRNARPSNQCTSVNCVSHLSQRRFGRSVWMGLDRFQVRHPAGIGLNLHFYYIKQRLQNRFHEIVKKSRPSTSCPLLGSLMWNKMQSSVPLARSNKTEPLELTYI